MFESRCNIFEHFSLRRFLEDAQANDSDSVLDHLRRR